MIATATVTVPTLTQPSSGIVADTLTTPRPAISPSGAVAVAWEDNRFSGARYNEVALSVSRDGRHWTRPHRANTKAGVTAMMPTVAFARNGTVGVTYYDVRHDDPIVLISSCRSLAHRTREASADMTEPTLKDIYAARSRVYRVVRPTPLMRHPLLAAETGLDILVKHENHNPTGAFKVRGGAEPDRPACPPSERARRDHGDDRQSRPVDRAGLPARGRAVHDRRAGRQQSRKERGDARLRRRADRVRPRLRRGARAGRAAAARNAGCATSTRPTSRC